MPAGRAGLQVRPGRSGGLAWRELRAGGWGPARCSSAQSHRPSSRAAAGGPWRRAQPLPGSLSRAAGLGLPGAPLRRPPAPRQGMWPRGQAAYCGNSLAGWASDPPLFLCSGSLGITISSPAGARGRAEPRDAGCSAEPDSGLAHLGVPEEEPSSPGSGA